MDESYVYFLAGQIVSAVIPLFSPQGQYTEILSLIQFTGRSKGKRII